MYDLRPVLDVPVRDPDHECVEGWSEVGGRLLKAIERLGQAKTVVVVDCYCGVNEADLLQNLASYLRPSRSLLMKDALKDSEAIDRLIAPYTGGADPLFGRMCDLGLESFFDPLSVDSFRRAVFDEPSGCVLVVGCGARMVCRGDISIYADLSRWEAQGRHRANRAANLGSNDRAVSAALKYKRAFFVDWRVCDRWKEPLVESWDFFLDSTVPDRVKLAEGESVRRGLRMAATQPFRLVPFFDPAPWGGQWLKEHFGLRPEVRNYGWGFDCVPEENSLILSFGGRDFELPAFDLVLYQPEALLGREVFGRFGAEFPIRFDLLDTIEGGNLSLQVHPTKAYIRKEFGIPYTQDESYYILDAGERASVYLGLKTGVAPESFKAGLETAQSPGGSFDADLFVNQWPARRHDHFLIPAGTVHCSGAGTVVLEVSATPYIFTFKLWDWARLGLDGKPRPINLERGFANIDWSRETEVARNELINRVETLAEGPGWREERTGLHPTQFIETRRHWFSSRVDHDTKGTVNVINLVQGSSAIVESPTEAFLPLVINFAETFIVPASVGPFSVRPTVANEPCATLKAFVRSEAPQASP